MPSLLPTVEEDLTLEWPLLAIDLEEECCHSISSRSKNNNMPSLLPTVEDLTIELPLLAVDLEDE
jgi:hypothetical protein